MYWKLSENYDIVFWFYFPKPFVYHLNKKQLKQIICLLFQQSTDKDV